MKRSIKCAHGIPIRDCAEHWPEFDAATTSPKSTPEGVAEILAKLAQYNLGDDPITDKPFTADETMAIYPELREAAQALDDLYTQRFREAIGGEEEPVYGIAKIGNQVQVTGNISAVKNSFRAEAIKRWEELSKGDV